MQTVTNPDPPTQHLDYHPLSSLFPLLDEQSDQFLGLVEDIRHNGLREPVVLFEGKVLDGRNRLRACHAAACEPRFERFESDSQDDARAYVISRNLHRRHLTKEQRDETIRMLRAQGMTMDAIESP